jgi:serine/threonine-protein kinase
MPGKVKLTVTEGPMKGKEFVYDEHDTFLFGRQKDCHAHLPDDNCVSRHHFLLEVNPPDARVRDLGSLNGTIVNDRKHGGRDASESPEEAAKRQYPEVDLKDNDRVKVGVTVLQVHVEAPAYCCQCGGEIAYEDRARCQDMFDQIFTCDPCRKKLAAAAAMKAAAVPKPKPPEPVRCAKCHKNVSKEVGPARRGNYVCESCRKVAQADPAALLQQLLRDFMAEGGTDKAPSITGYEIGKRLGIGGFGAVYQGRRNRDNLAVALKVMLSKVAVDENSRKKFLREIDVMKELRSDHIVPLYDHGSAGSAFYFAMELCDSSVADLMVLRRGSIPLPEAKSIMIDTLKGLADAHRYDIIHRDLKPHNLLIKNENGRSITKVTDFGLAKNFSKAGFSGMTVTGQLAGTPPFMPREQITNFRYVKPPCDIWSIGATFYNMLTGQFPRNFVRGKDPMEIVLHAPVIPIRQRNSAIPAAVATVIDKALDDNIAKRYADAGQMLAALQKAL